MEDFCGPQCRILVLICFIVLVGAAPSTPDPIAHVSLDPSFNQGWGQQPRPPQNGISAGSAAAEQLAAETADGRLRNGDFGDPPDSTKLNDTLVLSSDAIPYWTIHGRAEYITVDKQHGVHAVKLGSAASISQIVPGLNPNSVYCLSIAASRNCSGDDDTLTKYTNYGGGTFAVGLGPGVSALDLVLHGHPTCNPVIYYAVVLKELVLSTTGNLLSNGDFEVGPNFLNSSSGVLLPYNPKGTAASPLPGWTVLSTKGVRYIDSAHFHVPQGKAAVILLPGNETAISTAVLTVPGDLYKLTFAVGNSGSSCRGSMVVEATAAGKWTVKVPLLSHGEGETVTGSLLFHGTGTTTAIGFSASFNRAGEETVQTMLCGPVLDDVRVDHVSSS